MEKRKKNLILINIFSVFIAIAFIFITKQLTVKCYFFELFNLYCPFCGGTRAINELLKLNILASLRYNPSVLSGLAIYVYYNVRAIIAIMKKDKDYFENQKYILIPTFACFVFTYFILRNILLLCNIDLIGV